jgi:hypothetical protein
VLLAYLQQLRGPNPPGLLPPKLRETSAKPQELLVEHLARLEPARVARASDENR